LLDFVYPVIPSGGGTSGKAPLINWQEYQTSFPTPEDIENWENDLHPSLWGIVTGKLSTIVVVDIDKPELKSIFDAAGLSPHIKTPRGGYHYWFRYPDTPVKTMAGLLPGIDIRADGGFVNVIGKRADGEYQTLIVPTPDSIYPWEKLPAPIKQALNNNHTKATIPQVKGNWVTQDMQGVPEGQRDAVCTRLAGYYLGHNLHPDIVKSTLYTFADRCSPPLHHADVDKCVDSITKRDATLPIGDNTCIYEVYSPCHADVDTKRDKAVTDSVTSGNDKPLPERIKDWLKDSTGWCSYDDIDRDLALNTTALKDNRRQIIKRLKEAGIVEANPKNNKLIRYINTNVRKIDFKAATKRTPLNIKFPFQIEQYFNIYSGNIVVVAGAPDAGKTGWILNFIRLNQDNHAIFYQCSEMDKEELASRLMNFEGIELDDWTFEAEKRSGNFADVIRPDCINIIDYMELTEDIYMVADYLKAIHEKLESGIAIVALQKKIGAHLGRGAEFSLEKPRLYLSMDAGKTTIVKAKNWVKPDCNPNGLVIKYKIVGGCKFIVTENWQKPNF
jgi:hypothetical protein